MSDCRIGADRVVMHTMSKPLQCLRCGGLVDARYHEDRLYGFHCHDCGEDILLTDKSEFAARTFYSTLSASYLPDSVCQPCASGESRISVDEAVSALVAIGDGRIERDDASMKKGSVGKEGAE